MTQTPRSPESLERRISTLESSMVDLRASAEALLQTAQLHQANFEVMAREMNQSRRSLDTLAIKLDNLTSESETSRQRFERLHAESNQRFEIMLADMRQFRIESELRFNGMQTEIRRMMDQFFNQNPPEEN